MKRILAHKIIYADKEYPMSVVTIENGRIRDILPFECETHSTVFISGTVKLVDDDSGVKVIKIS